MNSLGLKSPIFERSGPTRLTRCCCMFFTGFRTTPGGGCMWDAGGGGGDSGCCCAAAAGPPSVADMARCSALPLADVDED